MGLNLGRGSILCPYRAFAILGGNDDHDRELCPSSQEATADLHLLFHCRQDGILARLALLPQNTLYCPRTSSYTPSSYPSQGFSNAPPPSGKGDERDTAFASTGWGVKLPASAQRQNFPLPGIHLVSGPIQAEACPWPPPTLCSHTPGELES